MEDPVPSEAPVTPVCVTVQAKEVPATLLVRSISVSEPEQNSVSAGVAVTTGIGLTVIVTSTGAPSHPLAEGVMV